MFEEEDRTDVECVDIPWTCKRCNALLGYGMDIEGKTYLRIKVKDSYIEIIEPQFVKVSCRKCGYTDNALRPVVQGS